jgi:8-oxo-dGTP diphosphatase
MLVQVSNPNEPMNEQQYVAGFMFNACKNEVALIRKNKPEWQKGLLNGIGGKMEPGEFPRDAMLREFQEETSLYVPPNEWRHFAAISGPDWRVYFFATTGNLDYLLSPEEEKVERVMLSEIDVLRADMIENLPWLISLALDHLNDGRPKFVTAEYP